jgi:hypothetical protein
MSVIRLQTTSNKAFELEIDSTTTISILKSRISEAHPEIPYPRLIYKGRFLQDSTFIASLNVPTTDFIRVQAGRPPKPPESPPERPILPPAPAPPPPEPVLIAKEPPPVPVPTSKPLPPIPVLRTRARGVVEIYSGPLDNDSEFQAGIATLLALGFPRKKCESALRSAYGDLNRAANYLARGRWPKVGGDSWVQAFEDMKLILRRNPAALENVVRDYEQMEPDGLGANYRERPEELVAWYGLDPTPFDFEAVKNRTTMPVAFEAPKVSDGEGGLSEGERDAIARLVATSGAPERTVIDVYLAVHGDELRAAQMLEEIFQGNKEDGRF